MEELWWKRVSNAIAFISEISDALLDEKSILLQSSGIPWRNYLISIIEEQVQKFNSMKSFEYLFDVKEPGPYLLKNYCKTEKRARYRPSITYPRFFAESDDIVLHERFFWIEVKDKESLSMWAEFVSQYISCRKKEKERAVFILEWKGNLSGFRNVKGISQISFDEFIGEYDHIVFSTLASAAIREVPLIKQYLAELVSSVIGNDIELISLCIGEYMDFLSDPYSAARKLIETYYRQDGSSFTFDKSDEEVDRCVWQAQIRTIYPLLEEYRQKFVQQHESEIFAALPDLNYNMPEETYDSPRSVELGKLLYLSGTGALNLNQSEYQTLDRNRSARNCLSHLDILTIEEIRQLVDH